MAGSCAVSFPPAPLRQDAIAKELAVSRIPVREALMQLEAQGLVKFEAHRGAVVTMLDAAAIEELFYLRALLKPIPCSTPST